MKDRETAPVADSHVAGEKAVRAQLKDLLRSEAFEASPRNRRFLEHIVEETLSGRAGEIKAFTIATAVFARDESFDPQTDPIVRIEAGRLRRALDHYYLTKGRDDPVRITIPKGSYVPVFQTVDPGAEPGDRTVGTRDEASKAAAAGRRGIPPIWLTGGFAALLLALILAAGWGFMVPRDGTGPVGGSSQDVARQARGPAIFVAPFEDESAEPVVNLSRGMTRYVITGLTRFRDLFVLGFATSVENEHAAYSREALAELGANYLVTGVIRVEGDRFLVTASLVDAATGQFVWSDTFDTEFESADIVKTSRDVADEIVGAMAQRHGPIYAAKVAEIAGRPPETLDSYQCVILFDVSTIEMTKARFDEVRACLERVVEAEPTYWRGHSSLALAYTQAYRYRLVGEAEGRALLDQALVHAARAVELAPNAVEGYLALHDAYWLTNRKELSFEAGEKGYALNPNNVDLLALLGSRYAFVNDWERGIPMVERALARSPTRSSLYRLTLALHHYVRGQYEAALNQALLINLPQYFHGHVVLAIIYAKLGRLDEARAEVDVILSMDPDYAEGVFADLRSRNLYPELIEQIVDGLRLAGMEVPHDPAAPTF